MPVIEIAGLDHLQNVLDDLALVGPDIVLDIMGRDGPSSDERENEHPAENERGPKTVVSRRRDMKWRARPPAGDEKGANRMCSTLS